MTSSGPRLPLWGSGSVATGMKYTKKNATHTDNVFKFSGPVFQSYFQDPTQLHSYDTLVKLETIG